MQVHTFLKLSVLAALATIALKTLAWWLTGSVGLLSDGRLIACSEFLRLELARIEVKR